MFGESACILLKILNNCSYCPARQTGYNTTCPSVGTVSDWLTLAVCGIVALVLHVVVLPPAALAGDEANESSQQQAPAPEIAPSNRNDPLAAQVSFERARVLLKHNVPLLAMVHFDHAIRLAPYNADYLRERSLCAAECKKGTPISAENDQSEVRERIVETLTKIQNAWNKHDAGVFLSHYDPEYLNGDGYSKEILSRLTTSYWESYPNARTEQNNRKVFVCGDYACAISDDITAGAMAGDAQLGAGNFKLTSTVAMFLHKKNDSWKVVGDIVVNENTYFCVPAGEATAELSVPQTLEVGKEGVARLTYIPKPTIGAGAALAVPASVTNEKEVQEGVWASLTVSPIKYPPKPPREGFFSMKDTMVRPVKMPMTYDNALIIATIWISKTNSINAPSKKITLTARVNTAPPKGDSTSSVALDSWKNRIKVVNCVR